MTVWVTSDWHLGHKNMLEFTLDDNETLVRPGFRDLEDMRVRLFDSWNDTVKPGDKVYCLGDMALGSLGRDHLYMMHRLPGKKRLVRGNHDLYDDKHYHDAGFSAIYGVKQINSIWLTHVPMHPQNLLGRAIGNVHGHMHTNFVVIKTLYEDDIDLRYYNACVEPNDYQLINLEEIRKIFKKEI